MTRRVSGFLNGVPVPMLAVDQNSRVVAVNPAAISLFGQDPVGRPFITVLRQPAIVSALDWVLNPDASPAPVPDPALPTPADGVVTLRAQFGADGRDIIAEVTVAPLPSPLGRGATIAVIDRSVAEEAEQMRRDFVANVSHELKTPLTAMIGFIDTLRGPARDDARARDRFLNIMEREAGRMNRLISDLLSLSRVQAEERRRPSGKVDLAALVRNVVPMMMPVAEAADVRILTEGLDTKIRLPGDPDQLTQVFQNLIENAIKYGGTGGEVRVSITRLTYEPLLRGPGWAVAVQDSGEGIEEQHLPRLTERFYRVDTHRARTQGGTGLGLSIVKHIINRHRGRLRIESTRGQGSRFTVILPEGMSRG
ncbi:cell wall metabolism sensor histidine kinase WalK [Paracoccus sp. JM45]|uniref:sensor histidine kinase n=1 Tax=Paracoccus sp. JM45 TaxID=2283626 RepID=UPI000E6CB8C5|nr:ATP-binding protein [Paracoccus sp. JM45]RJE81453.1 PAS domain-containing protein [Paracoccus sp. JM45]